MHELILVGKREAARLLSVSLRTIDNLLARHELPYRRIGRRVLISSKALEQFVRRDHPTTKQHEPAPTAQQDAGAKEESRQQDDHDVEQQQP
jgi:excisionase family DNA binding protein